ncbi:MAG: hypothetical protein ABIU05_03580 [Nitrospirales bacterium]
MTYTVRALSRNNDHQEGRVTKDHTTGNIAVMLVDPGNISAQTSPCHVRVSNSCSLFTGKILHCQQSVARLGIISHGLAFVLPRRLGVRQLRRLVEDTIDEMIDALLQAMQETGSDEGTITKVQEAKSSRAVEDKIKAVAALVPNHLRPGGVNPFGLLYGLLSAGLHDLTEEECLEIADGITKVFDHIFVEMNAYVEQRRSFTTGIQVLQIKYADTKKRPQP